DRGEDLLEVVLDVSGGWAGGQGFAVGLARDGAGLVEQKCPCPRGADVEREDQSPVRASPRATHSAGGTQGETCTGDPGGTWATAPLTASAGFDCMPAWWSRCAARPRPTRSRPSSTSCTISASRPASSKAWRSR